MVFLLPRRQDGTWMEYLIVFANIPSCKWAARTPWVRSPAVPFQAYTRYASSHRQFSVARGRPGIVMNTESMDTDAEGSLSQHQPSRAKRRPRSPRYHPGGGGPRWPCRPYLFPGLWSAGWRTMVGSNAIRRCWVRGGARGIHVPAYSRTLWRS